MKLLVTDIDSTLSVGETVSEEVISACRTLCDNGWQIMVATGRTLQSCLSHIRQISAIDTAIVYDGARVMSVKSGKEIMGFQLLHSDVHEILEISWNVDLEIQITGDECLFCRESDVETREFCNETALTHSIIDYPNISGNVYRVAFWGDQRKIRSLELVLRKSLNNRFNITRGGDKFLDVLPKGVSKGNTLSKLISLGFIEKPELIVAAGDHMNDYELLSFAQLAAVPDNCAPEVLKLADIVMPTVQNHGFTFLVETLVNQT
jgi:Cof subfamily protein (haloacid dehalogenase superfamily)